MWYDMPLEVTKGTSKASPVELLHNVPLGMVEGVRIQFPPGCLGLVKVTLWRHEQQILPLDRVGYITGDDYTFDGPLDFEITAAPGVLRWVTWNEATLYNHTITVGIFVRAGKRSSLRDAIRELFI